MAAEILRPGINIESWPEVKYARALEMRNEFFSRIAAWEATIPLRTHVTQTGPREATVTLEVKVPPPLSTLAVSFGDAVHNLRAALDATVWAMATYNGATPDKPKLIQMPTYDEQKDFDDWLKRINGLPLPEFEERIRELQPFERARALPVGQTYTLSILHLVDIIDKHRNAIAAASAVGHLDVGTLEVDIDPNKLVVTAEAEGEVRTGTLLATIRADVDFHVTHSEEGVATAQFSIPVMGGFGPVVSCFDTMFGFVRRALQSLYGDRDPTPDLPPGALARTFTMDAGNVTSEMDTGAEGNDQEVSR